MPKRYQATSTNVEDYWQLFVNRRAYVLQSMRPHAESGRYYYFRPKAGKNGEAPSLAAETVRRHLEGDLTIGVYAMSPATQRCKWIAMDGDYKDSLKHLCELQWELQQQKVEAALEQSRRGAHLWIFGEQPLLARQCRLLISGLAQKLGIPVKGAGTAEGIEIFPKHDELKDGDFGNATRQLASVESSDALRILVDEKSIASFGLRKVQRQEPKEYRDAIRALRINPANGFARLEKMDAVHKAEMFDRPERVSEAYRSAKGDVLVVCPTHEEIRRVTEAIRSDLTSDGKLGKETTLNRLEPQNWTEAQKRDMRNYEPGQVLVFHKGTKYAHKHEAMTVLSQEDGILHVRSAQGRETTITKKQAKCFGVFAAKDIGVAPGDWLSIQANMKDGPYQFAVSFR